MPTVTNKNKRRSRMTFAGYYTAVSTVSGHALFFCCALSTSPDIQNRWNLRHIFCHANIEGATTDDSFLLKGRYIASIFRLSTLVQ